METEGEMDRDPTMPGFPGEGAACEQKYTGDDTPGLHGDLLGRGSHGKGGPELPGLIAVEADGGQADREDGLPDLEGTQEKGQLWDPLHLH